MRSASRSTARARTAAEAAVTCQAAALVLSYPDERLVLSLPALRAALAGSAAAPMFAGVLDHLEGHVADRSDKGFTSTLLELQAYHVQEFDLSRRHALHLTYWTEGDTRRRGETLTAIKQLYRESGLVVRPDGELPDYLPMMLEFAVHDPDRGLDLLARHRPSLELLRLGLEDDKLPHAGVLRAICDLLPGASPSSREAVQAMVKAVQPVETVGLEPFMVTVPQLLEASPGLNRSRPASRS